MKAKALLALLPLAMLAACAAERAGTTPSGTAATDLIRELQPCGVTAPRTPGDSEYANLLDGPGPVRPCHPITADHVAFACEVQDGEVVYDPDYPDDEERALWVAPDISVSDLQCHDISDDGSEVSCEFTATHDGVERRVSDHRFTHWYFTAYDETSGHSYADTSWRPSASCLPPEQSDG